MLSCEFRRRRQSLSQPVTQPEEIDFVHHQNQNQPQSFGDFGHGYYYSRRPYTQVNLPFSYYHHRSKGTTSLPPETRYSTTTERSTLCARKPEEAQVVPFHTTTTTPTCLPERTTTSLQSIPIDDNGTPATWTLVLSQQATDRQDRIQTEGRFSLLELLEIQPVPQEYSHYRTRTHRTTSMTCLVGTPSIEATPCCTAGHHLTSTPRRTTNFASQLRQPSHRTWTFKTTVIKTRSRTTNHRH